MKKTFKFILIGAGALAGLFAVVLAAAAIIIPLKFPPAKMKSMAIDKLSQTLHRKVSIGEVHFNVFSGFKVTGLKISNREGWSAGSFVSAKEISISYHLWPLLGGRIALGEIDFIEPQILVERRGLDEFNFTDMMGGAAKPSAAAPAVPAGKEGSSTAAKAGAGAFALSVDSFQIDHGKMAYVDETARPAQRYDLGDLNVRIDHVSLLGGKTTFNLDTPFFYNKLPYHFSVGGAFRYSAEKQSLKELQVTGKVNDLDFQVSGGAVDLDDNFSPDMDGNASLDMLKFSGLVPQSLSQMPSGLSLTGPAKVSFHLGGDLKSGLELSGKADGSGLVIQYKDLFVKTNKTLCVVDFKSRVGPGNSYDLPSFKVAYENWEVTGAFHHKSGLPWSCEVHSKSLPFKGLSGMIPKLKSTVIDGEGSLNLSFFQAGGPLPFRADGQVTLKGVGVTLPQEPYLQDMNGSILVSENVIRVPGLTFKSFDGTGVAGVTCNGNTQGVNFAFALKNVNAQKAIDSSIDAYVVTKDFSDYKDKLYGTLNIAYAGAFKGFASDAMLSSMVGSGNYTLDNSKVKGFAAIKAINKYFKDPSDEINFEQIKGNLLLKKKVLSYSANTIGKVGAFRVMGGINVEEMTYSPDMKIQSDIKKGYLDSDAFKQILDSKDLSVAMDEKGNIPIDFKFVGKCSENHYSLDPDRLLENAKKNVVKAIKNKLQNGLGDKLKGLFGQ